MNWTETDLRTLHAEHLAGAPVAALSKRYKRPNHNLIVAWAQLGLFQAQAGMRKTRRHALPDDLLRQLHAAWMGGESLMSIGRRTGTSPKGLRCAFAIRGLPLKQSGNADKQRTSLGTFAAAEPVSEADIAAAIARTRKFMIPEELRLHWNHCDLDARARIIAALRARHAHPNDRPETPFSGNVIPFDYATPAAREIAAAANAGLPSQRWIIHLKINSQGVIWNGRLFFWVRQSKTYIKGIRWTPENGRPILARIIWETANGTPVPDGFVVRHRDGNPNNLDPSNLYICTRDELSRANQAAHLTRKARAITKAILAKHQSPENDATDSHLISQISHRRH